MKSSSKAIFLKSDRKLSILLKRLNSNAKKAFTLQKL